MDPSETALKYTKSPGFATTHGQEFEWTLAALLHLRALNSDLEFQLATNVKGAGALDDIVFRFRQNGAWRTTYVQLKHKDRKWLSRSMLTKPDEAFSLSKYFKSYLEIKKAMSTEPKDALFEGSLEDSLFVIFTNATGNEDLGEKLCEDFSGAENFLWTGSGSVFSLEKDNDMLKCLGECGDDGKQFLKQLRVFCGQPSGKKLLGPIKEELRKMDKSKIKNFSIDRICDCFLGYVKVWWETKNDVLHKGHNILEAAFENVRLESCCENNLNDFNLELIFEVAALSEFNLLLRNVKSPVTHVVSSETSCRMTLTKLWQAFEGQSLLLKIEQLLPNKRALLAESLQGNVKRLVICADKGWPSDFSNKYLDIVNEVIERRDNLFSIVFLSDENNSQVSALTTRFKGGCESYADTFMFSQLKEETRNEILDKILNLQGHDTPLGQLLSKDCESLDHVLNASLVVDILGREGPLTVGCALPEGIGYFVERLLEQPCVKPDVLQALRGTVTVLVTHEASARGLCEKALEFLASLKDSPSFDLGDLKDVTNQLVQTPLEPDENDYQVLIGPKFPLGLYECNFVGLRFGQQNAVPSLSVVPSNEASQKVRFLFICNETNEEDARNLSKFHQSEHLLSLKNSQLRFIQSKEDLELIQKYIDVQKISTFAPETATNVEDRLMLVCAEPGMGKSTLMARLAKNTKAAFPHYFVILIALNDHTKLFAQRKHADVLEFLSIATKMESPLQRSLLKFALEISGNVVVIADGFDEIAPRYVKECCQLLSRLLNETKARKIWMTSRTSVKQTIEMHFSKFSAKLTEFDREGQKKFFNRFWGKISILSEIKLNEFIDDLLEKSSKAIVDQEKNFLGIPLQCQMLAEVFEDNVNGSAKRAILPDKLDLFSLLEMFVDKKCKVYVENKLKIPFDDTNYDEHFDDAKKKFIDSHSKAGLVLILGEDELKTLGMEKIIIDSSAFCNEIQLGKDKTGFVDEIINDKPRFIHRVFAEYFVANWISQHLAESAELIKSKMFTADFAVIRYIFNGILSKDCVLHTAVLQENVEEVGTLLESEGVEAQDGGGRTALHLAAGLGTSDASEENKRRGEILDLIIGKTSDFKVADQILCGSPLRYADITRTWVAIDKLLCKTYDNLELGQTLGNVRDNNMLDVIFQQDLDKLLRLCLDNGLEVEHRSSIGDMRLIVRACEEGSFNVAFLLIERNADINQIKDDGLHDAPLIAASLNGHLNIVKLLHQKCVSNARPSHCEELDLVTNNLEPCEYINMKSHGGGTAMHFAAFKGHAEIIGFLLSHGGDQRIRDRQNRTPLDFAAGFGHLNVVQALLQAWDDAEREDMTLHEYIGLKDKDGYSVLYIAAFRGSLECVRLLLRFGGKLSQVGFNGQTPLMAAARAGRPEMLECLLENFNVKREGVTVQEYNDLKDKDGNTVMHLAAKGGSVKCVKLLHRAGVKFSQLNSNGQTSLMLAAGVGKSDVVEWLLENFNEEKEGLTMKEYIDVKDKDGNSVMHFAAWGGCVECVEVLINAGVNLSEEGWNGETPLMKSAREGKQEVVEWGNSADESGEGRQAGSCRMAVGQF